MSMNSQKINGNRPPEEPKDWTIMLYVTADGTLTNFAVESLKQLNEAVSTPPEEDDASVIVAAHFSFPGDTTNPVSASVKAPGNGTPPEYIFEAPQKDPANSSKVMRSKPVGRGQVLTLPDPVTVSKQASTSSLASTSSQACTPRQASTSDQANMSEKEALKAFLDGVYSNPKLNQSKSYALILWGHGPELLLQPPEGNSTGDSNSLYLTPEELREVLEECIRDKGRHLNIIGFDACFMSMFEMAGELKGLAHYMVASQDEVPDQSFPYACLVELFREQGKNELNSLLSKGVQAYVSTYQDCICNSSTEMNPVTLSALNLNNCGALSEAVKELADSLVNAKNEPKLQCVLIQARKESQDYAGGLYVDLYEFCENLGKQLGKLDQTETWIEGIGPACQRVIKALDISKEGTLILANCSVVISNDTKKPQISCDPAETTRHGISIYLPYLTDQQSTQVQRPLVKGGSGTHSGKGFTEALNGAGIEYLMSVRRDLILDTESYYPDLQFAKDTHWYNFISQVWTRALIKKVPADLDYHYSAQQSWMNVCRESIKGNNS